MSNLEIRKLVGKTFYRLYHAPIGRLHASWKAGGPWVQRRTEEGRREMEAAALLLPALPQFPACTASLRPLELHLLTGNRFWDQTAFCLYSFSKHAQRALLPIIYDDGSLTSAQQAALEKLFPATRVIPRGETETRLDQWLPRDRFPFLRERWEHYPNIRKLIDPHLNSRGWKLVIDSDLLFFRRPDFLLDWLDQPQQPLHAIDVETSYGYSPALLSSLAGHAMAERVNVGLTGLQSETIDWSKLEHDCRTLIEKEGTHYYLEQALIAMLVAGRPCAIAPEHDYVTLPRSPEVEACKAVMHHYVADSKRWYFQHNWRRVSNG